MLLNCHLHVVWLRCRCIRFYGLEKSLRELNLRARLKINVIGIKKKENLNINPGADDAIEKEMSL